MFIYYILSRKVVTDMKVRFVALIFILMTNSVYAANIGRTDNIFKITPTNSSSNYDYVLLFSPNKGGKIGRAVAEIENFINKGGQDRVFLIGEIGGCIVASVVTSKNDNQLRSKYAAATRYAELSNVWVRDLWDNDPINEVAGEPRAIRRYCR